MDKPDHTTCPYCGVGCGLVLNERDRRIEIGGDSAHPVNRGRLCVKGAALGETLETEGRLLHPMIGGLRASWNESLDAVAADFRRTIERHGPDAVAFYVSGQLLSEDYYVANKLIKGFIGSANIDTNSRLCMSSSVAGHVRAFGSDTVPGCYEDLDRADLVVLVGSNAAWCHPVLFRRMIAARESRPSMRLVVIDPRRTATAEEADLHLPLRPGTDAVLFNGLFRHLARSGFADQKFVSRHTEGFDAALAAAEESPDVAALCDLDPALVGRFFDLFASTERVVTCYSQGVHQSSSGSDKVNAIINCHLLTGRIGRPGMGPFSLTGQPNAMGGREVGGLANQLAAHMGFEPANVDRVRRFWKAPRMAERPGLKAVDLFRAVGRGEIRALWIMATNPAVSMPEAGAVRAALERCDCVVVSDCVADTDTARFAHVLLPALAWGEKSGTVTNSERRISRQRAILPAPGGAKADWWAVTQVARRLGFASAFPYESPAEIFREHCRLSAFENDGRRDFDIGGLAEVDYDSPEWNQRSIQWPVRRPGAGTARLFADGRFFHPDGRARFVPIKPRPPIEAPSAECSFILNTGRTRDQWHTMTRSGRAPRLSSHAPQPTVALAPQDAAALGIADDTLVRVSNHRGSVVVPARLDAGQRANEIFIPIHWSDSNAAAATVGRLIAGHTDPVSGQPELKHTPVRIEPVTPSWRALAYSRKPIAFDGAGYWCRATGTDHILCHLAGFDRIGDWPAQARAWFGGGDDWIEMHDSRRDQYRAVRLRDGRLDAALFVFHGPAPVGSEWPALHFTRPGIPPDERAGLLAGVSRNSRADRIVCACFSVGLAAIEDAVAREGLVSAVEIGRALKAGTNCGSCLPEIKAILALAEPRRKARAVANSRG